MTSAVDQPAGGPGRIAFVQARYGPDVVGGAEAVLGEFAHGLAARGWDVDVLTTCATDLYTWDNVHPPGPTRDGAVGVVRFPAVRDTDRRHRGELTERLHRGGNLSITEEQLWANDDVRVPELWHHLARHGTGYRAVVVGPYLAWTTYAAGQIHPDRTILVPCLHDEPEARLRIHRSLFAGALGVLFLSEPEAELAQELFDLGPRQEVLGAAVDLPARYDPEGFRRRHGIEGPFVYFGGRREGAKGWPDLLEAYAAARRSGADDLLLVTSGAPALDLPTSFPYDGVVDLGFVSDEDRDGAMAAASAYVQPSALESFSRTVLEAFGAGTPVIANGASAVVAWHIERSGAGVTYRNRLELTEALRLVAAHHDVIGRLGGDARAYVVDHYAPARVFDRLDALVRSWTDAVPVQPRGAAS